MNTLKLAAVLAVLAVMGVVFPSVALADYRDATLATHPDSYWPLDETSGPAVDIAHAHNGAYVDGCCGVESARGAEGAPVAAANNKAFHIKGNASVRDGNYGGGTVNVGNNGSWQNWFGRAPFSVNLWLKWDGYVQFSTSSLTQGIVGSADYAFSFGGWSLEIPGGTTGDPSLNQIRIYRNVFGGGVAASTSMPKGEWVMVTATYDGAALRLYKNGVLADERPDTNSMCCGGQFRIGAQDYNRFFSGYFGTFNGTIDEVAYWNRALNPTEIDDIRNGRGGSSGSIVYFVPGVAGTDINIDVDGRTANIWPNRVLASEAVPGAIFDLDVNALTGEQGLVPEVHPGNVTEKALGLVDVYGNAMSLFKTWHDNGLVRDFVPFAYDWRLGVEGAATRLANDLQQRCGQGRIWLVTHSTGGLVTKVALRYLRDRGISPEQCFGGGGVFFIAVPHAGAAKAIGALINPDLFFGSVNDLTLGSWLQTTAQRLLANEQALARVVNHFLTVWQLMPQAAQQYDPLHARETWFDNRFDNHGDKNINGDPLDWTLNDIAANRAAVAYDYNSTVGNLNVYNVLGWALETPGSYQPGGCNLLDGTRSYDDLDRNVHLDDTIYGDETVPVWSSLWPGSPIADQSEYAFGGTRHMDMPEDPRVQTLLQLVIVDGRQYPNIAGASHGRPAIAGATAVKRLTWRTDVCSPVAAVASYAGGELGLRTDGTIVKTVPDALYEDAANPHGNWPSQVLVIPKEDADGYPEYHFTAVDDGPVSIWQTDPDKSQHDFHFEIHKGDKATLRHESDEWALSIDKGGDGTVDQSLRGNTPLAGLSLDDGSGAGGFGEFGEGGELGLDGSDSSSPDGGDLDFDWELLDDDTGELEVSADRAHAKYRPLDGPKTARIKLTVTNKRGQKASTIKTIQVPNAPPTVDAGPDVSVPWGVAAHLDGSVDDASAADRAAGLHPHWTFGDGSEADGASATHAYAQPGVYTATLTATDKDGATASDTVVVTVTPRDATLTWTGSTSATYGSANLSARLTDAVDPATARLNGLSLVLNVAGADLAGSTGADGAASFSTAIALAPAAYDLRVTLGDNALYRAAPATGRLTIVNGQGEVTMGVTTEGVGTAAGSKLAGNVKSDASGVSGQLEYRRSDGTRFHVSTFNGFGVAASGDSAWIAGWTDDQRPFLAHLVAGAQQRVDIWIAGVRDAGSGAVTNGALKIRS